MDDKKWEQILQDIDELERKYFPATWLSAGQEHLKEKEVSGERAVRNLTVDEKESEVREKEKALFHEQKEFMEKRFQDKSNDYEAVKKELLQANQFLVKEIERYHREVETLRSYLFDERKLNQGLVSQKFTEVENVTKEMREAAENMKSLPRIIEDIRRAQGSPGGASADEIARIKEAERISSRRELDSVKTQYEAKLAEVLKTADAGRAAGGTVSFDSASSIWQFYFDVSAGFSAYAKNLLSGLESAIAYIMVNMKISPELREQLGPVSTNIRDLENAYNEYSALGRLQDLKFSARDVLPVMRDSINDLYRLGEGKQVQIVSESLPQNIVISCDEKLFKDIFWNSLICLFNISSVKASISINYENKIQPVIIIESSSSDLEYAQLSKTIKPFSDSKKSSVWLSFSLARKLILMHGGELIVRQAPGGKGVIFELKFAAK